MKPSIESLLQIRDVYLTPDLQVEACGHFTYDGRPFLQAYGEAITCQHKSYTDYIWHTHPTVVGKPYPSGSDIVTVLRIREHPKVSFIFTKWGFWTMRNTGERQVTEADVMLIQKSVQDAGDWLYRTTENATLEYTDKVREAVKVFIRSLTSRLAELGFKLDLQFTSWRSVFGS